MSTMGRQSAAKRTARLSLVAGVLGAAVLSGMTFGVSSVAGAATASTAKTGGIEVCKYAGDSQVQGTFNFKLTGAGGFSHSLSVPVGSCSGDISAPVGQVTVTETAQAPFFVAAITASPASDLVSANLAGGSGVFTVVGGQNTTANFWNKTNDGSVKVCKTLTATSGALVGMPFEFIVSDSAVAGTVTLTADATANGAQQICTPDPVGYPLGSTVTITEVGQPNVQLVRTSISPRSQNAGSTSTVAVLKVGPVTGSVTAATFTNQALGWVEVCKNAADPSTGTQSFPFTVNGGSVFTVHAGQCSQPFQVPTGTASINEIQANPNFFLANVSTKGVTDPTGSRLLSGPTTDPAIVQVVFGGVGNETVATFTDAVRMGDFKICKAQTSPDANLQGSTATFDFTYTVNNVTHSGTVSLIVPLTGATCSGLYGPIPVVNADGSAVTVSVTEETPGSGGCAVPGRWERHQQPVASGGPACDARLQHWCWHERGNVHERAHSHQRRLT
jgi:hypothetical protein